MAVGAVSSLLAFFTVSATASLAELAEALPPCAACMCTDVQFTAAVELCVAGSCTVRQSLTTKNVTATTCGQPVRDRTSAISITGLAGGAIALLVYLLRVFARLPCCGGQFGADDWVMTLTMGLVIPISIMSYVLAEDGLGKDLWNVPFDNITHILYIYFIDECLYLAAVALTKISILCFYLRVFPRRAFRISVYVVMAMNVAYIFIFDFITIFQCSPLEGAWYRWEQTGEYKCRNINSQGWAAAVVNMALDIIVMALPLRELWNLNLSWRKKAFVMCMFSLGIFVTLVSIIRLESLIVFANTTNLTWDYTSVGYWSTIELHVGVICASLPALRSLFRQLWPSVFGDTSGGGTVTRGSNTNATSNEYDYIIVGSGAGGAPLASRLALAGYSVLLLDAGDDQGEALHQQIPALQLHSVEYEPMQWDYFVNHYDNITRQKEDSKMVYRTPAGDLYTGAEAGAPQGSEALGILYPRSGTLGGCTAHNAMVTIYPYERDWDDMATLTGNETWGAESMRGYFKKLENNRYAPSDIISHGFTGWLQTSLTQLTLVLEDIKLLSLVIAAGTAAGQNLVGKVINTVTGLTDILLRDLNSGLSWREKADGLFQVPLAIKVPDYKRTGPRDFVLDTVDQGYSLTVQLTTLVTNVIFDKSGSTPRAVGVDYLQGKSLYRADPRSGSADAGTKGKAYARKEVIISTGTFNTPQLLKLSGIGPKAELAKHGIETLVDLPGVGKNMQDRYEATIIGETPTDFTLTTKCTFLESMPDPCYEDWKNGVGFKGTYMTNGIAIAIIKQSSVAEHDEPDLLISGAPGNFPGYFPGFAHHALEDARHWSWIVLKSRSRNNAGTVELRSSDPRDTPIINFHSFDTGTTATDANEKDLQAIYEGMKFSREIFDNLVPLDGDFSEVWPGRTNISEADEEGMKEHIKREAWGHHACCTAPIGNDDDEMAVLDADFRVRGVEGLRVVDASVFPKIPGYYIALPIFMVSEKAADVILADAGRW
ncbi:uncharacterized protein BDV14DRAFT_209399 [Aspergillus stella-maris]|uniref:uncharacterized protein n=1 Tax=Aspergillus stella-maris TaxID=1810926 RepID=UPI003CCE4540